MNEKPTPEQIAQNLRVMQMAQRFALPGSSEFVEVMAALGLLVHAAVATQGLPLSVVVALFADDLRQRAEVAAGLRATMDGEALARKVGVAS